MRKIRRPFLFLSVSVLGAVVLFGCGNAPADEAGTRPTTEHPTPYPGTQSGQKFTLPKQAK